MRLNIGKRELQKCTFNRKVALFTPSEQSPLRQRGITAPHHFDPPVTIARGPGHRLHDLLPQHDFTSMNSCYRIRSIRHQARGENGDADRSLV
jgi:hypothetical protein